MRASVAGRRGRMASGMTFRLRASRPGRRVVQWRMERDNMAKLKITYVKSSIGYNQKQKATIQALGLRKLHQVVEHADTPVIRGMVNKVPHLVRVEEVAE